jgi:hypothetical protein
MGKRKEVPMPRQNIVRKGFIPVLGIALLSATILMGERRSDERTVRSDQKVVKERITPLQMNYQGYLASSIDTAGVTGSYDMSFRLYAVNEGGSPVWSEDHNGVQVDKGVFNVYLGEFIPIPADLFDGNPLWLEIQVGTETLSPRKKIVSVGYSIRSQFADTADYARYAKIVAIRGTDIAKPCTLSARITPGGILYVNNTAGVWNSPAIYASAVGGPGLFVKSGREAGVYVDSTGPNSSAFYARKTTRYGVEIDSTAYDGLHVKKAGRDGIHVEHADNWAGYFSGKLYTSDNVGIGTTSPGSHRLYVQSAVSGVSGATAYIQNTHTNGLAMIVEATSNDLPLLVSQKGDGDIFRCDSWTGGWHPVFKVENDGTTTCSVLQLTGGSDLSEQFDIKATAGEVKPGMLVCIDPEHLGELIVSREAYDRKVAGIISGAGGIEPGMLMGQKGSKADGSHPIALTGRVYCWVDASYGAIEPGDLLTTSNIPGHAMKVTDYRRAQGAIIGKAMSSLEKGQGLVLVLVSLQ